MSLAVEGLNFAYRKNYPVLREVQVLPLPAGKVTALIGPNAAGKSTFFRCVAGLLQPDAGRVILDGLDLATLSRRGRTNRVCFMPQSFAITAALTVFELVLLARKHLSGWRVQSEDVDATENMLRRLGIEDLAETYVGDLSGGQQQMVSIAQALVRAPALFLLDEPTSALDLRHQLEIMTVIRDVTHDRGITTITALHDLNLAARFADHLLLMREGRIIAEGPPSEILRTSSVADTYGVTLDIHDIGEGRLVIAASL